MKQKTQKTILIVLDGVGEYKNYRGNAVKKARTPFLDSLYKIYPWTVLQASGNAVGLPKGVQGASEPGHLTMGAGRIVYQPFEEINQAIRNKRFQHNKEFLKCFSFIKKHNGSLHLLGMISDGGVHSHIEHLFELLKLAKKQGVKKVYIHGITDGRDVPEQSAMKYIKLIQKETNQLKIGTLSTLIGRYYAMDRDRNYNRTKVAYDLLTKGVGIYVINAKRGLDLFYRNAEKDLQTDYYLMPMKLSNQNGFIHKGDGIIFFNFRSDRAKQLSECFTPSFAKFATRRPITVPQISFVCVGPYSDKLPIAFPPPRVNNNVGIWIAKHHLRQLRIAETEKFAHVTFFFNSQVHQPCKGETRILIPSSKVASYAQKPEMSAYKITNRVLREIAKKKFDFILINFANGDLVGHSGSFKAAKKAIEILDHCLSKIVPTALRNGYNLLVTADHGNSEYMINPDGSQNPSHTTNPVRVLFIAPRGQIHLIHLKKKKSIASVGPTIIKMIGLPLPKEMSASPLF